MSCEILLLGDVSSGKSSMVNTISLQFIAETSQEKLTRNVEIYKFKKNPNADEKNVYRLNSDFDEITIIDTPGFTDSAFSNDNKTHTETLSNFLNEKSGNAKIVMYIIDRSRPCMTQIMYDTLSHINEKINENKNNGNYIDFFVIFNKFDRRGMNIDEAKNGIRKTIKNDSIKIFLLYA